MAHDYFGAGPLSLDALISASRYRTAEQEPTPMTDLVAERRLLEE
jgi:hypothetical protein